MSVEPDVFRRALRKFATGITVVTVSSHGELHGMTASSFASVSLQPPLVLVCLDKTSRTLSLIEDARLFAVNVLSRDQEEISRAFARPGTKPFPDLVHRAGQNGAPLLEGAVATIECTIHEIVDGGDHEIVLGEVTACEVTDRQPLLYYDGAYRSLRDS